MLSLGRFIDRSILFHKLIKPVSVTFNLLQTYTRGIFQWRLSQSSRQESWANQQELIAESFEVIAKVLVEIVFSNVINSKSTFDINPTLLRNSDTFPSL
jgi:hypothetical protein